MKNAVLVAAALLSTCVLAGGASDAFAEKAKEKAQVSAKTKEPPPKADPGPPLPDLVVLSDPALTKLEAGGCEKSDPLIKGIVALRNQGTARAKSLLISPIVATYIPEMLDIKDEDVDPNSLNIGEIMTKDVTAGKGVEKHNRGLKGPRTVYILVDPYNKIAEGNEINNIEKRTIVFNCP